MGDLTAPIWVSRADGLNLAARPRPGRADRPTIVFLPGLSSDMQGRKAIALVATMQVVERARAHLRMEPLPAGAMMHDF